MREVTYCDDNSYGTHPTQIEASDDTNAAGMPAGYFITSRGDCSTWRIPFQNGPFTEGCNGVLDVDLLAVLRDRMACAQAGPFACMQNAKTLALLEECMMWQQARQADRLARSVQATNTP